MPALAARAISRQSVKVAADDLDFLRLAVLDVLMTLGADDRAVPVAEVLTELCDHIENTGLIYQHKWKVGDIIVWDNRCTSHARTDFPTTQRRLMKRVTIVDGVAPPDEVFRRLTAVVESARRPG